MKRLIAMRCTIEEFETLGVELDPKNKEARDFIDYNYLCNSEDGWFFMSTKADDDYEYHETFNKDIFLEACGLLPKYEITKETAIKYNMKDEFPELFDVELKVGEWYKWKHHQELLLRVEKIGKTYIHYYGFDNGEWVKDTIHIDNDFIPATPQEVKTALINEAVKRGFEAGYLYIEIEGRKHELESLKGNYQYLSGILFYQGAPIMNDGTWAIIIPTLTKQQAEEKFNIKII